MRLVLTGRGSEPHFSPMTAENSGNSAKPPLKVLLCSPRGFCAGVVRAIDSVEQALKRYGAPVYVRHEIVHNRYVVESLKAKGAIFVEELSEIPDTQAPVIFSAHGVPKSIPEESQAPQLLPLRRHLPAGDQGPSRGRDPPQARPRDRADRPRRPSRSGRHARPAAGRRADAGADRRGGRGLPAARRQQACLCDADHAVARRHRRHRRRAQAPLPGHRRSAQGRHLLRHHQPPGGGQARGAAGRCAGRGRRAELVQLAAASGGRRARRLLLFGAGAARGRDRLVEVRRHQDAGRHRRRVGARGAGRGDPRRVRGALHAERRDRVRRRRIGHVLPAAAPASRQRGAPDKL